MGRTKSPVDELVDGLDAIGTILDENLPQIKTRLGELEGQGASKGRDIQEIRGAIKESNEIYNDLRKAINDLDIKTEEIISTIGALARRLDQLQKSVLDLMLVAEKGTLDPELADTIKTLEDRINRLEGKPSGSRTFPDRF